MNIEIIVLVVLAIFSLILTIKFLKKIIKTIAIILTVVAVVVYVLFFADLGSSSSGSSESGGKVSISIFELRDRYCKSEMSYRDSIKCNVIVLPIYNDIVKSHDSKELESLKNNNVKMLLAMRKSILKNKKSIQDNLKRINGVDIWEDFVRDLKGSELFEE